MVLERNAQTQLERRHRLYPKRKQTCGVTSGREGRGDIRFMTGSSGKYGLNLEKRTHSLRLLEGGIDTISWLEHRLIFLWQILCIFCVKHPLLSSPPVIFSPSRLTFFLPSLRSALIQQICIMWVTDALILSSSTTDLADTGTFKHSNLSH